MKNTDSRLLKTHNGDMHSRQNHVQGGKAKNKRNTIVSMIAVAGVTAAAVVIAVALFFATLPLWLSPSRLASIIGMQAEKYLNADIKIGDVRYSLWSSFPRFRIEMDSVYIYSEVFDNIAEKQRRRLPADADFLASASHVCGAIDVIKLISGRIDLHNVQVDSLRINLVSLNDSVSNYNIVKTENNSFVSVPDISANLIKLSDTQPISYYSAESHAMFRLILASASLRRLDKHKNDYDMNVAGNVSFRTDSIQILNSFPLSLDGKVALGFKPFSVEISDYAIVLGNIRGKINMSMNIGDNINVRKFEYSIPEADIMRIIDLLPEKYLPYVRDIDADADINISARLLKPYRYSPSSLPSVAVTFNIPDGHIRYTANPYFVMSMNKFNMLASLVFDGDNPQNSYFDIRNISAEAPGLSLHLNGRVSGLSEEPDIRASLRCRSVLDSMSARIPLLHPYRMSGKLELNSDIYLKLSSFVNPKNPLLHTRTKIALSDLRMNIPQSDMSLSSTKTVLHIDSRTTSRRNVFDPPHNLMDFRIKNSSLHIERSGSGLDAEGICINGVLDATYPKNGSTAVADLEIAKMCVVNRQSYASLSARNLTAQGSISAGQKGAAIDVSLHSKSLSATAGDIRTDLNDVAARLSLNPMQTPAEPNHETQAYTTELTDDIPHTYEYVTVNAPAALRKFVNSRNFDIGLSVRSGTLQTKELPSPNYVRNMRVALSNDSLIVRSLNCITDCGEIDLSASVGNIRQIISGSKPQTIPVDAEIRLGVINLNQLAYNYETAVQEATGHPAYTRRSHADLTPVAADSTAVLIPSNLRVNLRASARETIYTNLRLYNLQTMLRLHDGIAEIDSLDIASDFGRAHLEMMYDTRDIQKMSIKAGVALTDINVVNFFRNYNSLLLMMPEMKNLSGYVSAGLEADMHIFPSMCVNGPDINAEINVEGRRLTVRQTPFIRRITRMMMIRSAGDIHIHDINARACVHDNLLELYPFYLDFDRYEVQLTGLNNFNGNLYYHIGVDRSPLFPPFGIIIEGNFKKPRLRFGRASYNPENARRVTKNVEGNFSFNIPSQAKYFLKEMIHRAALAAHPNTK